MNIQTVDNVFSYFRDNVFSYFQSLVCKSRLLKPFSIYLQGSSYRESTVISKGNEKRKNQLNNLSSVPTVPLCPLFLCAHCSSVPIVPSVPPHPLFLCSYSSSLSTVPLCPLYPFPMPTVRPGQ